MIVHEDPWSPLRCRTAARIALGRAGGSAPTRELLDFGLAHARARDAVHAPFDAVAVADRLASLIANPAVVTTGAADRRTYLQRPDLGRRLSDRSRDELIERNAGQAAVDLVFLVSDGLSARAAESHAPAVLEILVSRLLSERFTVAPLVVAPRGRVALQDEVGELVRARAAVILLGERPGLGSPDSLGAYLVFEPRVGRADAERNCVSNIRPEGLPPAVAAETLHWLISESLRRRLSGVDLKDERAMLPCDGSPTRL